MKNAELRERKPWRRSTTAPLLVLAVFLLLTLTRYLDASVLDGENEQFATIILELMIFLLPAAVYLRLVRRPLSQLRITIFGVGHILIVLSAIVTLTCGSILLGYAAHGYGALTESYDLYGIFISHNDGTAADIVYLILAYAVIPAICEEFTFRALLCSEYERRSAAASILMPSLFFAMIHFDLTNFPTYFFAGVLLALTYYATQSLAAPVVVHAANNLLFVFGRPYLQTLCDLGGVRLFIFLTSAGALLFAFIFCAECARAYKYYAVHGSEPAYREMDPPYTTAEGRTALSELAVRFPRITATLESLLSLPALACYIFFALFVLFGG